MKLGKVAVIKKSVHFNKTIFHILDLSFHQVRPIINMIFEINILCNKLDLELKKSTKYSLRKFLFDSKSFNFKL